MRNVAVILAGGTGRRIGLQSPKQLIKIAGKSIIEHTLHVFDQANDIDDIVLFMQKDFIAEARDIIERAGIRKVIGIHRGGVTRSETTRHAIDILSSRFSSHEDINVLIHDAVRPLLSQRVISDCAAALDRYDAVDVAIPTSDTMIVTHEKSQEGLFVADVPSRAQLQRGQTPQGFKLSTIRRAYDEAAKDPDFRATDDCSVVLRYLPDVPIKVVRGDEHNMKVTQPVDVFLADKLFQLRSQRAPMKRSDEGYRDQLHGTSMIVFGASHGIGADIAAFAEHYGCRVFRFSRSLNGTHVECPAHVEAALSRAHEQTGRVDFVVNTAGLLHTGRLTDTPVDVISHTTDVNYLAPIHIARASHRYLARTGGQLLLFTSSSYTRGRHGYSLYSSAKAATVNLTQALAEEWAPDRIRVNCVNPERTRTPMRLHAFGEEPPELLLTSEAVASTAVDVLLSDMTGHVIDVRRQAPLVEGLPAQPVPAPDGPLRGGAPQRLSAARSA